MPTKRVELGKQHVEEALAAAKDRTYTSGNPLVFVHVREDGLQLRVQGGSANWYVRYNGKTKSIGKVTTEPTVTKAIAAAVERGRHVRALLERGDDPTRYLQSLKVEGDHGAALADSDSQKARAAGAWTWSDLRTAYRDRYLSQPKKNKAGDIKPPSPRTLQDFDRYTSTPAHKEMLDDVLVRDMTAGLIEDVRDAVQKTNGMNGGRKAVQWVSAAMTWGQKKHSGKTGLGVGYPWWTAVSPDHVPGTRKRYLSLEQIAKVLYAAEKYRQMPYRKQAKPATDAVLAGLWWIVLSAQRTSASMSLLSSRIIPDVENPGWLIAAFPAEDMKSKRYHALPIPPRMTLLFDRAKIGVERQTAWAFPSAKVRRAGSQEVEDIHVHDSTVGQLIDRLRGKDDVARKLKAEDEELVKAGQPPSGRVYDLLEGVPEFSPHDLRRSLATILTNMKVRGDAASAVLDHSSKTPGEQEFQEADITRLVYNQSQRLPLKAEAMTIWTDAVFAAVETEWKANRPATEQPSSVRSPVRPPSRGTVERVRDERQRCLFTDAGPWYLYFKGSATEQTGPSSLGLGGLRRAMQDSDELEAAD
ncbi:MAG: integrase family protein [Rhizobiaceae bacterium]|nr:integrase family protein [Rhizobiaceae bacterium]